ncbi:hypothetical protein JDV02_010629 [Purpureocillium takamizusanense]|uniref:Uncharacterized protein n=1 Tax=Purpureocillium takamizusanense TaxID=2060973 RepID=A0A9Q8QT30_9HYPO|nr:uncharacterized protein JDV02_010629 [Purpureocillium takamizusanense]UNI24912.1 hypothetical protein JDV02_010629 [Purpureocillium takamizusanense]
MKATPTSRRHCFCQAARSRINSTVVLVSLQEPRVVQPRLHSGSLSRDHVESGLRQYQTKKPRPSLTTSCTVQLPGGPGHESSSSLVRRRRDLHEHVIVSRRAVTSTAFVASHQSAATQASLN